MKPGAPMAGDVDATQISTEEEKAKVDEARRCIARALDAAQPPFEERIVGFALMDCAALLHARLAVQGECAPEEHEKLLRVLLDTFEGLYRVALEALTKKARKEVGADG